ncbi:MAG: hypothetical protein PHY30_01410 [Candidatus Pacebacteria bacterium]|nr:hypothetical protein [Candidatus Paceibacterota bacterium]
MISKRTLLIMIFGFILLLGLSYFSNQINKDIINNSDNSLLGTDVEMPDINMDYTNVLNQIGGGEFKNDYINASFSKDWLLNKTNPTNGNLIKNNEEVFLSAYSIEEDTSIPWIFSISKIDSFEPLDYLKKIQDSNGELKESEEDGSFIAEFANETNKNTIVMQKIVKNNDQKFIVMSLLSVNAPLEKIKEVFNGLISGVEIINYAETAFLPSLDNENSEEEDVEVDTNSEE